MPVTTPERRTHCVRVVARDGTALRFLIGHPVDLLMSNGEVYRGGIYATNTAISATVDGGPTVIDIGSVYDPDGITRDELQSQKWDGAKVYSFFTDWAAPAEDEEPDRVYQFGKVREEDERFTVEMLSLIDLMSQTTGRLITPACLWTFCDSHIDGEIIASDKSRCKLDPATYTFPGEVSTVSGSMMLTAGGLAGLFPDDYFGNGELRFTTGDNAGLSYRYVKAFIGLTATITLNAPFYYPIAVGDEFQIMAGCRKRIDEDCVTKFVNGIRFGGFPDVPQKSSVQKFGDQ